jgi:hypothetical protein
MIPKGGLLPTRKSALVLLCALLLILPLAQAASSSGTILKAPDVATLIPPSVFFRGQSASVQMRNAGGVKYSDGMLVLAALVDTSGYSTAVQQKYQAYFITEVTLDIQGQTLKPGAYGVGFVDGSKFLVMDLGAHDLFTVNGTHDADLKRPTPLQVLPGAAANHYRLYINRNYIDFSTAPTP